MEDARGDHSEEEDDDCEGAKDEDETHVVLWSLQI